MITLLFFMTAISGAYSKSNDHGADLDLGEITLAVTGDMEGAFSGMADFGTVSTAQAAIFWLYHRDTR